MKRILTILASLALIAGCEKPSYQLGEKPDIHTPQYSVTPEESDPNVIRFTFNEDFVSPFWRVRKPDGSYFETCSRDFTLRII